MIIHAMSSKVSIKRNVFIICLRVAVFFFSLLIYIALITNIITDTQGLVGYTLLLLGYLFAEAKNLWASNPRFFWINPVVLASIFAFALSFGVSNVLFFMPENVVALVSMEPIATPWMNKLMLLVILAACAMWVGYGSTVGRAMGRMLNESRLLQRLVSPSTRTSGLALYACIVISLIARLIAIKLGVYGYASTYDDLIAGSAFREYLTMAESLGKLALVGTAMQCFSAPRSALPDRHLLWFVLVYEVFFGFIAGFKSAVVLPFIIVGVVYYTQRMRFPRWLIPAVVGGMIVAYAVIEPFRAARNDDLGFQGTTLGSIVGALPTFTSIAAGDKSDQAATWLSLLARINLTYIASQGIEYAATRDLPEDSPAFMEDIFLAPAHALVPRLLWENKPLNNSALWYTNVVLGVRTFSATSMSPVTYLNFAGGPLAVIIGFLVAGILQRGFFDGLLHFGGGGLIVLLGLLTTLALTENAFNIILVAIIRLFPALVIAQYLLLKRSD